MTQMKTNESVMDIEWGRQKRESVVVCVTDQTSGQTLIERGAQLAREQGMELRVLSVLLRGKQNAQSAMALEALFQSAMEQGATMSVYYSEHVWTTADHFLKRCRVRHLVVGRPRLGGSFVPKLYKAYGDVPLHVIEAEHQGAQVVVAAR